MPLLIACRAAQPGTVAVAATEAWQKASARVVAPSREVRFRDILSLALTSIAMAAIENVAFFSYIPPFYHLKKAPGPPKEEQPTGGESLSHRGRK